MNELPRSRLSLVLLLFLFAVEVLAWIVTAGVGLWLQLMHWKIGRHLKKRYYRTYRTLQGYARLRPNPLSVFRDVIWPHKKLARLMAEIPSGDAWLVRRSVQLLHAERIYWIMFWSTFAFTLFSTLIATIWWALWPS